MLALLRRSIFEPLYVLKNDSQLLAYWKELEKNQFLSEEILRERQWKRLVDIIYYIYDQNTFYRKWFNNAGIHPDDIKAPADMKKIPILSKEEIRKNTTQMISKGFNRKDLLKFKTGGSTGKPLEIYITEECSEQRNACARRHDRWTEWEMGEPVGALWGNPEFPKNVKEKLRRVLLNPTIILDTMSVNVESVRRFAQEWKRVKPTLLFGHAHSIYLLAKYVEDLNLTEINPKSIISTSMMLLPHERRTIERIFKVKIFDRYGCEEVSLIASECEKHKGLHLNIEHLLIEFIKDDGNYAKPGEPGNIVVTDLMNYAMPFIRYAVGDIGVPSGEKCSCGRGLPLMESVAGRVAEFLIKKDGTKVAGVSLIENTLTKISGIKQMQIVQETLDLIKLNIVRSEEFSHENEADLISYFEKLFQNNTTVNICYLDKILPEKSGKYRFAICNA